MKKQGLAKDKGLGALLNSLKKPTDDARLLHLPIKNLVAGKYQPRRQMNDEGLVELSASIARHGVMQPIVVRPISVAGKTHEIIAGERRFRAAKMAGLEHIPAIERHLSDELAMALALIENIQREELSVLDTAAALARFHEEFGLSHASIAEAVGKARATISNLLRLNQLSEPVKVHLDAGRLDMGHARALLSLDDATQISAAKKIIAQSLTVRETEQLVKTLLEPKKPRAPRADPWRDLGQDLGKKVGAPVKIRRKNDKGSIEIAFNNEEEFNRVIARLSKD